MVNYELWAQFIGPGRDFRPFESRVSERIRLCVDCDRTLISVAGGLCLGDIWPWIWFCNSRTSDGSQTDGLDNVDAFRHCRDVSLVVTNARVASGIGDFLFKTGYGARPELRWPFSGYIFNTIVKFGSTTDRVAPERYLAPFDRNIGFSFTRTGGIRPQRTATALNAHAQRTRGVGGTFARLKT